MSVKVKWRLVADADPAWRWTRVLYAYLHPSEPELLYIGKADGQKSDLLTRWRADDKRGFWEDLEAERQVFEHRVLVGVVHLEPGRRLSRQLLADIESLLISRTEPWGNIQAVTTRISRPGMEVRCVGRAWPASRKFVDS